MDGEYEQVDPPMRPLVFMIQINETKLAASQSTGAHTTHRSERAGRADGMEGLYAARRKMLRTIGEQF